jgi:GTPase
LHPVLRRGKVADGRAPDARLAEAVGLARAIALEVASAQVVKVSAPSPATLIGSGSVARLADEIQALEPEIVVVDASLSPVQQRNLERAWKTKVIDRTGLILEIFGERAQTREGQMQVELAALTYQRSRLVRSWTHLERQRGGFGFLGGPGESQLEIDRRLISERIQRLKADLEGVKRTRGLHRDARDRVPYPVVALVGYTNAGKSTLFNRLTGADVVAADMLFATLDPTMRQVRLPSGRKMILSDTVGFISELPTMLIAAFRATLEEVLSATLVLHVRDAAHHESGEQRRDVQKVLNDIGIDPADPRLVEVLNKIDLLDPAARAELTGAGDSTHVTIAVSAVTGEGCDRLLRLIDERMGQSQDIVELEVGLSDGASLAWLYRRGEVLRREDRDGIAHLQVRLDAPNLARFRQRSRAAERPLS